MAKVGAESGAAQAPGRFKKKFPPRPPGVDEGEFSAVPVGFSIDSVSRYAGGVYEFYNLGLGDPVAVSAVHGHGTGDLLDECVQYFPPEGEDEEDDDRIQVAIIGKPNVGKSSLTNKILGQQRTIVSNVAGTTRDAIDSYFENETGKYVFIDTAGMRKKSRVDEAIERYSVLRAQMAIERADVCLILIDAQEGVTEQDTKVAGMAHEAGKASIIVVNKWDLIEKDGKTMDKMRQEVRRDLSYMTYAPILFISAATGQRVDRLFELIQYVNNQAATRITTGMLNSVLADAQTRVQPPTAHVRPLNGHLGPEDAVALNGLVHLGLLAHPGGVDEHIFAGLVLKEAVNGVPGGAGHIADNGALLAQNLIGQGGLAHVGLADDGHLDPVLVLLLVLLRREVGHALVQQVPSAVAVDGGDGDGIPQAQVVDPLWRIPPA